jgi:hypothetical protein
MWTRKVDMDYTLLTAFFVVALFSAMFLLLEVGRRIAVRRMAVDPEGAKADLGAVVGVVFSLLVGRTSKENGLAARLEGSLFPRSSLLSALAARCEVPTGRSSI